MRSCLYLAYGSNLLPARIQARVPSARAAGTVRLGGWSLRFHKLGQDGSAKCNLVETGLAIDTAHGAIFAMAQNERVYLDRAEGLGRGYERAWLELPGFGRIFFYAAAASHITDKLRPFSWYRDLVAAGARHHGFPADYVAHIRGIDALMDPDHDRHKRNLAVLDDRPPY